MTSSAPEQPKPGKCRNCGERRMLWCWGFWFCTRCDGKGHEMARAKHPQ